MARVRWTLRAAVRAAMLLCAALVWQGEGIPTMAQDRTAAEPRPANRDEAAVPPYTAPELLTCRDGSPVTDADDWRARRRPELLALFTEQVYGRAPERPATMRFELLEEDARALGGLATRRQIGIAPTGDPAELRMDLLLYLPNAATGPVPVFLALNFDGNHTIHPDPAILLPTSWVPDRGRGSNQASDESRGGAASRWPVERILSRGYGLATMYYGDIDPDYDDGFANGIEGLLDPPGPRPADAWGAISAWAWGLSRCLDALETDPAVDAARVAVLGHSRLGKTALWAGAQDERFALVISNDSGCGGAALSKRVFGESVGIINKAFPHWFCANFHQYSDREEALPLDQHMLCALIAPRPLYIASAQEDWWADPRGEFLSALLADPAYRLLGTEGLPTTEMPPVDRPVMGAIGYHVRTGEHDVLEYDWLQYLTFADRHLGRP